MKDGDPRNPLDIAAARAIMEPIERTGVIRDPGTIAHYEARIVSALAKARHEGFMAGVKAVEEGIDRIMGSRE